MKASTFEGKTVWITGASSGIGAELALAFDRAGARCVLSARRENRLEEVRQSCSHPDRHVVQAMDVTDFDRTDALVAQVEQEMGPVDYLVLNSGVGQRGAALDTSLDVVRRIMDVNFTGVVAHACSAGRLMAGRGSGHIVVISSVMGRISTPRRSTYSASKHALHGWFETLRAELGTTGVHVTIVCPGYVRTAISRHALLADGTEHGTDDDRQMKGMSPGDCASRILRAVSRRRAEVHIGGAEVWGIQLYRFLPSLYRRAVRGYNVV